MGPGGFRVEPFGIVAGRHQQRCRSVGANPEEAEQIWSRGQKQRLDFLIQLDEFSIETLDAMSQRGQRCLGSRGHRIRRSRHPELGAFSDKGVNR